MANITGNHSSGILDQIQTVGIENSIPLIIPIVTTIIIILVVYFAFNYILNIVRDYLLRVAKTKKQISNVEIFSKILRYIFLTLLILIAVFSYAGEWASLGLIAGLLSAALGFALQKPITGIAAWVMIVTKRPFEIGDRVIIGNVKGDVMDITLTHVFVKEIGGTVTGEEPSGRIVMVPNYILFEENITNYTFQHEFVLDQVVTSITYESDLDRAIKICLESAKKITDEFVKKPGDEAHTRISFGASSVDIAVRYRVPAKRRQEISSLITKEIYDRIKKEKGVKIAYPHTEVILRKKK